MPSSASVRVRLPILAGLAWLLVATLQEPAAARLDVWPWAALGSAGWAALVAGAALLALRGSAARPPLPVGGALLLYAAVTVLSAWLSPWQGGSLAAALPTLGATALLFVLVAAFGDHDHAGPLRFALDLAVAALVLVGLFGWSRQIAAAPSWAAVLGGRNPVPFGHSVYTAGAALLGLSWFAAGALRQKSGRLWRILGAFACGLLLISTASRAGAAALALGAGVFLAAWWWRRGRQRRDALVALACIVTVASLGVVTNARLRDLVLHGRWNAISSESNQQRATMAAAAVEIGRTHGWTGPGPGTLGLTYNSGRATMAFAPDGALQVHSAPLQVWATTGPAGAGALLLIILAIAPSIVRGLGPQAPPDRAALSAGALAYAAFALIDHQLDQPFIAVLFGAHLAVLLVNDPGVVEMPETRNVSRIARMVCAGLAVSLSAGPLIWRVRDLLARAAFTAVSRSHDEKKHDVVQEELATASARAPWDRFYLEAAASWRWDRDPQEAAERLRAARATVPGWPAEFATYNLAWLTLGLGDAAGAVPLFAEAARLAPQRSGVFLGQAFALAATGDQNAANRVLARHLLADPRAITTTFWDDPAIRARWPAVRTALHELGTILATRVHDEDLRARIAAQIALIVWWSEPDPSLVDTIAVEPVVRQRLRDALAAPPAGRGPWPGADSWGELGRIWADGHAPTRAAEDVHDALDAHLAAAPDFLRFVTSRPSAPALRNAYRVNRGGHRIVQRHPDSPDLFDFPVFEENLLLAPVAKALFARRGWLPGAIWATLPEPSATAN